MFSRRHMNASDVFQPLGSVSFQQKATPATEKRIIIMAITVTAVVPGSLDSSDNGKANGRRTAPTIRPMRPKTIPAPIQTDVRINLVMRLYVTSARFLHQC